MTRSSTGGMGTFSAVIRRRKAELKSGVRVTIAAIATLAVALLLGLKLPLWSVMASVVLTQSSVGRSLKASRDYLIGTLGGAVYGGIVAVLIPHSGEGALLLVLVLVVAPLAFLAAIKPPYSIATITALIVLLLPTLDHGSPVISAIERVIGVALGAVIALLVSSFVFPARAHDQIRNGAATVLDTLAASVDRLLSGPAGDENVLLRELGVQMNRLIDAAVEAERERGVRLAAGPDPDPLLRALFRLRHDLVTLHRVDVAALPDEIGHPIRAPLEGARRAIVAQLRSDAASLRRQQVVAGGEDVTIALGRYASAISDIRREGLTRHLSDDVVERFFALKFALEQIEGNLDDLRGSIVQWTEPAAG